MALNNSQYDAIMRDYQRLQSQHRHEQDDRIREAYGRFPRLQEIHAQIASESVACGKALLGGDNQALDRLKTHIQHLSGERTAILKQGGYPVDYLELTYTCPHCHDTGYIENQKCQCFKKAEIDLLYTQSNLKDILKEENFSTFSYEYYSDEIRDASGKSSLERIRRVTEICHQFIRDFDKTFSNLFFYGDTGVGKTFLSHCIAKELLDSTHSVIYFSAQELFQNFADKRFHRNYDSVDYSTDHIYDCDLLIIDDLGTELTNAFVNAELFSCINERLINQKSTIISTNLPLESFASAYSERIFSRISNGYTMLKLFGKDIRVQKKVQRLSAKRLE